MTERALNPHLTNTTSTIANEMPSVGKDAPPPYLVSSVDPNFTPKDAVPENTERMTGGTQSSQDADVTGSNKDLQGTKELGVGELEGASFKVEPLRRTGEDENTTRARLLCPFPISPTMFPFPFSARTAFTSLRTEARGMVWLSNCDH